MHYLAKGSEHEIDFIVTNDPTPTVALEVKYHPTPADERKLKRIAAKYDFAEAWLVGKYPIPGFQDFLWSGLIF